MMGLIILGVFVAIFLYMGSMFAPMLILPLIMILIGVWIYNSFKGDFKGADYWEDVFKNHPEKIVWIMPITVKHTAAYVVTLYREQKFQILTDEGMKVTIKCDKTGDPQSFLNGCAQYIPQAHIGYSPQVKSTYKQDPATFIQNLTEFDMYVPLGELAKRSPD